MFHFRKKKWEKQLLACIPPKVTKKPTTTKPITKKPIAKTPTTAKP